MKFLSCFFISLSILAAPLFSQSNFELEQDVGKIHIMTMDNGFTVFVKEDPSSAMIHTELLCKGGYSSQTPSTAGFIPLYTRLFSTTKTPEGSPSFKSILLTSSCNTDSSTYTSDVTPEAFENLLKDLSNCAQNPSFSEKDITNQFNALKKESEDNAKDATGFINCAIDSRVFAKAPWKTQSGIYPALFSSYKTEEIKTILKDIEKRFYTPDNCGLFVAGNISSTKAYNLALKYFGQWSGKSSMDRISDQYKDNQISDQKKFVLVDKDFSRDLTQIVVQYTGLSTAEADLMNAAFNSYASPYKELMMENPKVSLRSREYLASSSDHRGKSSRLILQALMEEPFAFSTEPKPQSLISPADQAEEFLATLSKSAKLDPSTFVLAKNTVSAEYRKKVGSLVGSMQIVADWWAMDSSSEENFYQRYLTLPSSLDNMSLEKVHADFESDSPFVFVLVNPLVYSQHKDSFEKNNYRMLTKENGSWYHNQIQLAQALENEKQSRNQKIKMQTPVQDLEDLSPASNFYLQNLIQIGEGFLDNGIPLVVKSVPHSQSVAISLAIEGGEAASPKDQRLLRTVLVNAYAKNLQDQFSFMKSSGQIAGSTSIAAKTEQTVSYLTVECVKTDFLSVMSAMVNALVYGDISASNADRLVNEQAALWSSKMMNLDSQMEYNALKYLFRDSPYSDLYDQDAKVLGDTRIVNIGLAYAELLDASIFSLAIVGDTDLDEATKIGNQSFGILHEQTQRKNQAQSIPLPNFKTSVRRVKLHHLYTSTLTKEQAGTEVPILIPTSDFYDPVQYFFPVPDESHQRNLYNCLLEEMKNRIQKYLPENVNCSAVPCTNLLNIASLRVNGILHTKDFLTAYKKARLQLISDLEIPSDDLIFDLKQKWISRTMIQTQTNLGTVELIQKGCEIQKPCKYLDDYLSMELCDRMDFLEVMKNYFPENPSFTITSVDSKN